MSSSAADPKRAKQFVHYYAQVKWYSHVRKVCQNGLNRRGSDLTLQFWKQFAEYGEGNYNAAIRELDSLRSKRDVEFPVTLLLIKAHKACKMVDYEHVSMLESALESAERAANEQAVLLAAQLYWHTGEHSAARKTVEKLLPQSSGQMTSMEAQASILRGWIDLTTTPGGRREQDLKQKSLQYFEIGSEYENDVMCVMGKAKYFALVSQYSKSLEALNQAVVVHSWYLPALTEKAKVLMIVGDWDQAVETAQRVLGENPNEIDALCMVVLYYLVREGGGADAAVQHLQTLAQALKEEEPGNAALWCQCAMPLARCCGANQSILQLTSELVEHAAKLRENSSEYATECGAQHLLMADYSAAMEWYRQAAKLDETNVKALHGMIKCQLKQSQLDDAAQQLEFLSVIQDGGDNETKSEFCFLQAMLAWLKDQDRDKQVKLLDEAENLHKTVTASVSDASREDPLSQMLRLDPSYMLELAKEYLQHCGTDPITVSEGDVVSQCLAKAERLLEKLMRHVPVLLDCKLTLAQAKFIRNDIDASSRILSETLSLDPSFSPAHLLMSRISLANEQYKSAQASLEQALSHDFSVRNSPVYHLVKAKVLENTNKIDEALEVLVSGMELPGVKRPLGQAASGRGGGRRVVISLHDRVSLFIQLAALYQKKEQMPEATKVIQDALGLFRGTTEEVRVIVANSELAIKRNDFKSAVVMLNNIPQTSAAYAKAQMVKANIYLQHRRDKRRYIHCYLDMVEKSKSPATLVHLGEAYMRIQEPEEAIKSFEEALSMNPQDSALASKIGVALVSTHDYHRAVHYYSNALRNSPDRLDLRYSLAELLLKLEKFENASKELNTALSHRPTDTDVAVMKADVKNLLLLAKVHSGAENLDEVPETLMKARTVQQRVLELLRSEGAEVLREQKTVAADVCHQLAMFHQKKSDDDKAMQFLNEALRADDAHEMSMLALARLHLRRSELESCQHQCVTLMRVNAENEEPSMMLADIMFRKAEYDSATFHFQQILERKPNNYQALSRLIQLLRRAGKLADVPKFLKMAERNSPRAVQLPGLHYCKGLHHRYTNDVHSAVRAFNLARRDPEWGTEAILNMVEIYLNPDNENLWEEGDGDIDGSGPAVDSDGADDRVRVAEKLMRELPQRPKSLRHVVLENYALMASKNKNNIEVAVQKFIQLLETERDYVPALLGMATAFMMQKQMPKARNQLKRISKMNHDKDLTDDFERSYLLLADIYIQRGKYDLAQELCKRCLSFNRSCAKAWEYMGLIMEKEQSYRDAADHYEQAWKFEGEASASVGYKLAFNYLKARRYVEAIDVCHKVLAMYPDYPKIKRDILEKARAALRP